MDFMDIHLIETELHKDLARLCKPSRIAHSVSTARTAEFLAARFGIDPHAARLAGLAHDLLKDRSVELQWETARQALHIDRLEKVAAVVTVMEAELEFADKIIHGPASAVFALKHYGLSDKDILEAIALHSQAAPRMTPLASVLFVADKMEPGRSYVGEAEAEALRNLELDELLTKALGLTITWLKSKGHAIAQSSIDLYNALTRP